MSNQQSNKKNKHILLKSTITASLLLTPTALTQTHDAHASENGKEITHDLSNHQQIKTKDILNKEKKQKIEGVDNKKVNVAKEETGDNIQNNTDNHGTYNEPFKYKDNFYEFGQGSSLSGAMKALDMEKNIPDKDISSSQLKIKDNTNIANITVPGKEKNVLGTGSAVAISKHALLTNNHVIRKDETKGFEHHNEKDINIYPQRDGDQIPYKLKPKKVDMLKSADASILYVDEDLSKMMDITPIANEKDIENMKENSDISVQGYPTGKRHENQVKYPDQFGHAFDAKSKFLMNATSIHPVMYYKAYTESGMSGSPVLNEEGKLIGIHAGVIDSNNGNNGDTSYGYTFTKNFRKDLIEKIPELDKKTTTSKETHDKEKATSESKKDDDIKENQDENKKENDNKTSKNNDNKSQDKEIITPSKDVKNTSNKNEAKAAETDQPKTEKDQSKSDDENHIKDKNPNEKSTQSNDNKETTYNDTKSNNDEEDNQSTENTSDKNNQKDKESSDDDNSDKETTEKQPSENTNSSNHNQTSKNDNTKSDDSKQENQTKSEKEADNKPDNKENEKSEDKNAKTHHSLGHIDKDKEEKTVANSKSKNDNDKEQATSEAKKDDDDSSENPKEEPKKESPEAIASSNHNQPTNDEKPEAENKNNQAPNNIEQATSEEPEQPKDHQTFKGLPDTGSTAGNVSLLAVTLTGVAGIAILGAQSLRKWRKNKINDID